MKITDRSTYSNDKRDYLNMRMTGTAYKNSYLPYNYPTAPSNKCTSKRLYVGADVIGKKEKCGGIVFDANWRVYKI